MNSTKHQCNIENAPKFLEWIRNRGGVAVWQSVNLQNPGASWSSPATIRRGDCEQPLKDGESADTIVPYPKPNWQCDSKPQRIVTSADDIEVCHDREVKRFRVHVKLGGNGLTLKCTDRSSARIRKEIEAAGTGAYHVFDYDSQEAVILAPDKTETLTEWAARQPLCLVDDVSVAPSDAVQKAYEILSKQTKQAP